MATVRAVSVKPSRTGRLQGDVAASVSVVDVGGEMLLQIDTFGSPERVVKGVPSQTVRLTRRVIDELARLAAKFPA